MPAFAQKKPFAFEMNRWAQRKVLSTIQTLGKALPCQVVAVANSIVTVAFQVNSSFTLPNVTCPMFGPEYIRYPTQIGDKGVVFPADAYLGGMSGLGGGVADLALVANLSALVFFPIGNTNWTPTDDPNSVVIYGPDGAILRTTNKNGSLTLTATGVAIKGNLTVTGEITAGFGGGGSVTLQQHQHGTGSAASGTVVPTPGT